MKSTFTYILLLSIYCFGFSQNIIDLNTSENKRLLSGEKLNIQNLPAYISISEFRLHEAIRNNEINIGDKIVFDFMNFQNIEAEVTYKNTDVNNVTSYICKFKDFQFSRAFIAVNNEEYSISIDIPEQKRKFKTYVSDNKINYYLVELDTANLDYLQCNDSLLEMIPDVHPIEKKVLPNQDTIPNKNEPKTKLKTPVQLKNGDGCGSLGEDDDADIRVLVLYTQASLNFSGSQESMDNKIAQAITRANSVSVNSNLGMNFILAHSELTTYVESADGSLTDLNRLRNKTDGFMDNAHTLRDTYAADFVHLTTKVTDKGGIAFTLNLKNGRETNAFGITRVQQLDTSYTLMHEVGHNMGASHSKAQNVQAGPTNWFDWPENTWSAGWRFQGNDTNYYSSVMAYTDGSYYPDGTSSTRIPYFSTPLINDQGQPVGDAVDGDNARTLKTVKQIVSKYRDVNTLQYCFASGQYLSARNHSISNINLNDLTNSSTWAAYNDFSYKRSCLVKGQTYPLTVDVVSGSAEAKLWVWIDWNNDFDFDDVGELVLDSATGSTFQYNTNVTPPFSAIIGEVRMRIRYEVVSDDTFPLEPCGTSDFGEVEDYTINIESLPVCEVESYNANTNLGFDGAVGGSSLELSNDDTTITGTFTKGAGDFNDAMVMYISTGATGRSVIDINVNDQGVALRRAISSAGTDGSVITFPSGFQATHAIAINNGFGGIWSIPSTGSVGDNQLPFIKAVGSPSTNTQAFFNFALDWADIGLNSEDDFSFVVTYLNSSNGFLSNEAYGDGIVGANPGTNDVSFTNSRNYPYYYVFDGTAWSPQNPDGLDLACRGAVLNSGLGVFSSATTLKEVKVSSQAILYLDSDLTADILFKSDANGSAQLADATGSNITGKVTTERFIPAGDNNKRAFRLITSAVTTTTSINANWQEGVNNLNTSSNLNPSPSYGTHISGSTTGENGFDATTTGDPSLFTFDNPGQTWNVVGIGNTNTNILAAGFPYRLMVRGDRSIDLSSNTSTPSNTTMRSTGNLNIGSVDVSTDLAQGNNQVNLVGNPYQAIVDFSLVTKTGLTNYIGVWDASVGGNNGRGGYVIVDISSSAPSPSSSDPSQFIAPGQAFFVENDSDALTSSSLVFEEADKVTGATEVTVFNTYADFYINSRLYKAADLQNGSMESDALGVRFNSSFTTLANDEDATKLVNPDENYAIINNGLRAIDKQKLPEDGHEIKLFLNSYTNTNYSLTFTLGNQPQGLSVYLKDAFLDAQTELEENSTYDFTVDSSIPASKTYDRFSLIFTNTTLGVDENNFGEDFRLYPNPTNNGQFTIKTNGLEGQDVELKIHNILGQEAFADKTNVESNGEIKVNASTLTTGLYLVQLHQNEQVFTAKLIVK